MKEARIYLSGCNWTQIFIIYIYIYILELFTIATAEKVVVGVNYENILKHYIQLQFLRHTTFTQLLRRSRYNFSYKTVN